MSHPVKPISQHLPWIDGSRLASKDEEGGLKSVFGVVMIQQTAASAPDHRCVPLH
jgi:hypothetical protein